jgi:catechol 2,3-dioxygenase-like lactoylglutathione lyase family enzyme
MINDLKHIGIMSTDLERTIRFHRDKVGMDFVFGPFLSMGPEQALGFAMTDTGTEVPSPVGVFAFAGGVDEADDTVLDIGTFFRPPVISPGYEVANNPGWQQVGLRVRDLDLEIERLRGEGVDVGDALAIEAGFPLRVALARDHDGHKFQLVETEQALRSDRPLPEGNFQHIHHVGATVADLERSLRFYVEDLGMTVEVGPLELSGAAVAAAYGAEAETAKVKLAWLRAGEGHRRAYLQLVEWIEPATEGEAFATELPGAQGSYANMLGMGRLAFSVTDAFGTYETLRGRGIEFLSPPQESDNGPDWPLVRWGSFLDPDGIVLQMFEFIPRDQA